MATVTPRLSTTGMHQLNQPLPPAHLRQCLISHVSPETTTMLSHHDGRLDLDLNAHTHTHKCSNYKQNAELNAGGKPMLSLKMEILYLHGKTCRQ